MNYVVTVLDERYWSPWGISWLASLLEISQTKARPVVLSLGLKPETMHTLRSHKVQVTNIHPASTFRDSAAIYIAKLAENTDHKFAYFDADCWFQFNVDELFNQLDDRLTVVQGTNLGCVAGNAKAWKNFVDTSRMLRYFKENDLLKSYVTCFKHNCAEVSYIWNCMDLPNLKDTKGVLALNEQPVHVIHPISRFKNVDSTIKVLFHDRYPDLFEQYSKKCTAHISLPAKRFFRPNKS